MVNKCSKVEFVYRAIRDWIDGLYCSVDNIPTGTPLSILQTVASSSSAAPRVAAAAQRAMAQALNTPTSQVAMARLSVIGGGHKRKGGGAQHPRNPESQNNKKRKIVVNVTALASVNPAPQNSTTLEDQQEHKLINMYRAPNPIKGGRDCVVCWAGVGFYSKGGRSTRKQTGMRCAKCKKYMCKECYMTHPAHAGFVKVYLE